MGYELNYEAYQIFTQIEVGIREFLIRIIRDKGVREWAQSFLGKVQLETIKEVGKRIFEADQKEVAPEIEDVYISKINRAIKTDKESFMTDKLCHPFYYLSWSDMDSLISKYPNSDFINESIGKLNREVIVKNLRALNFLRNDVAHSRFISKNDYLFIKGAFVQFSGVIPDFVTLYNNQSTENQLGSLIKSLVNSIESVESCVMLELVKIDEIEICIDKCVNSFWLNSIFPQIILLLNQLQVQIRVYRKFRESPGGLLPIQKWRRENSELLVNLKNVISERKI